MRHWGPRRPRRERRDLNARRALRASSNIRPKLTGDPDPGCLSSDVLTYFNDQGRTARITSERGAVLPLMALMLVVLMGAAAMAIDLGWLFWQSIEIQHGADAAALAGVIYEPDQRTEAHTEALAAATTNGYDDSSAGTTVSVLDFIDDPAQVEHNGQLRVTVTHSVDTFFLPVFGLNSIDIERTALAEYVRPVALGSPDPSFGDDPALQSYPGFYAQIKGNYVAKSNGDRFGALCTGSGFGADCLRRCNGPPSGGPTSYPYNPEGRIQSDWGTTDAQGGYVYGIELPAGSSGLSVEIFNGPLYAVRKNASSPLPATGPESFFGDIQYREGSACGDQNIEARTWFMLYGPDSTPADSTDGNELLCSVAYDERTPTANADDDTPPNSSAYLADFGAMGWDTSWLEFDEVRTAGYQTILNAMWDDMSNSLIADYTSPGCSSNFDRGPGTYLLRIMNEHDDTGEADVRYSWQGENHYTLRASTSSGDQPSVYAVGDMLIRGARNASQTEFYLARVEEQYAGKKLVIELWDVGDVSGGAGTDNFSILDGNGAVPDCDWSATNGNSGSGACTIVASNKVYNNELITLSVEIPNSYTCTGDECWWKLRYDYADGYVKDTTTWTAYLAGNPLKLIE